MKLIEISDELFDRLKGSVVDPFDDTPESVISRLIDIMDKVKSDKVKSRWSPLDTYAESTEHEEESQNRKKNRKTQQSKSEQDKPVRVL